MRAPAGPDQLRGTDPAPGRDGPGRPGGTPGRRRSAAGPPAQSPAPPPVSSAAAASRENAWRRPPPPPGDEIQGGPRPPGGSAAGPRPGGSLWGSGAFRTAGPGGRGPVRGYPPAPGAPGPAYPPGQFSPWNSPELRTAAGRPALGARLGPEAAEPGYSSLAVSDPAADATATQTWRVLDDAQLGGEWTSPPGSAPEQAGGELADAGRSPFETADGPAASGPWAVGQPGVQPPAGLAGPGTFPSQRTDPGRSARPDARPGGRLAARRSREAALGAAQEVRTGDDPSALHDPSGPYDPSALHDPSGPYDPSAAGSPPPGSRSAARGRMPGRPRKPVSRTRMWLMPAGMLVLVGALITVVYLRFGHGQPTTANASSPARHPTPGASSAAPAGPWQHITTRRDDPTPLTLAELFPAQFSTGGTTAVRTAAHAGTNCARMVLGGKLQAALRQGGCTQVMRASYLSAGQKIMATVGVLNLASVTDSQSAGKATGATAFIKQLPGAKGPTRNLMKGTGLEEAEIKGHYLILTWAEFTDLKAPTGPGQRAQLDAFSRSLVGSTANISLTSRMLLGKPATAP
ncbi:MAG TPA: hypothetical protein VMH35_00960 [Streptosporangiaceae bacterium]|nr:hypothetical protein [Streptosporangiaceae bacterium]